MFLPKTEHIYCPTGGLVYQPPTVVIRPMYATTPPPPLVALPLLKWHQPVSAILLALEQTPFGQASLPRMATQNLPKTQIHKQRSLRHHAHQC
jgi:hypothetical protein